MEKFIDILNDLIIEKNLSLRKLASESNISAIQYSKYLKGSIPTIPVAVRMANYFNCSIDYLFGINNDNNIKIFKDYDLSVFVDRYTSLLKINKTTHWKFSKKYGLSESSLRHWKAGDIPTIESLIIIATNLSCSIEYLIGRTDII